MEFSPTSAAWKKYFLGTADICEACVNGDHEMCIMDCECDCPWIKTNQTKSTFEEKYGNRGEHPSIPCLGGYHGNCINQWGDCTCACHITEENS